MIDVSGHPAAVPGGHRPHRDGLAALLARVAEELRTTDLTLLARPEGPHRGGVPEPAR